MGQPRSRPRAAGHGAKTANLERIIAYARILPSPPTTAQQRRHQQLELYDGPQLLYQPKKPTARAGNSFRGEEEERYVCFEHDKILRLRSTRLRFRV